MAPHRPEGFHPRANGADRPVRSAFNTIAVAVLSRSLRSLLRSPVALALLLIASIGAIAVVNNQRSANELAQLDTLITTYESPGDAMASGTDPAVRDAVNRAWRTYAGAPGAFQQRLAADHSPSGYWLQQAFAARDAYRRAHPVLDEYLAYQTLHGGRGTPGDFLKQRGT
jgi:hypothetical protein